MAEVFGDEVFVDKVFVESYREIAIPSSIGFALYGEFFVISGRVSDMGGFLPGIYLVFTAAYLNVALYATPPFISSVGPQSVTRRHPNASSLSKILLGAMVILFLSSTTQFVVDMITPVDIGHIFPFYESKTSGATVILGEWTTVINVRSRGFSVW